MSPWVCNVSCVSSVGIGLYVCMPLVHGYGARAPNKHCCRHRCARDVDEALRGPRRPSARRATRPPPRATPSWPLWTATPPSTRPSARWTCRTARWRRQTSRVRPSACVSFSWSLGGWRTDEIQTQTSNKQTNNTENKTTKKTDNKNRKSGTE